MSIKVLDKEVINKISAGEVVEKPASVVKELVENSIDAGATSITIEIEGGGIDKICVIDNGCGIKKSEVVLAFTPHATSKLEKFEDLDALNTMGFRGEALATISAVSKVSITTKTNEDDSGIKCDIISGAEVNRQEVACNTGTKIEVNNLFYNTPARLKFLRKPKSEESDITNYVQKLILSHCNISFNYIVDKKVIYNTVSGGLIDNIYTIYGKETASNMLEVDYKIGSYSISGYICKPEYCKANRTYQNLFVNSRYCVNPLISTAVSNAYENFIMKGKFPLFVLFVNLPQNELDVNVHPNKLEVKFTDTQKIYKLCSDGVFKSLSDFNHIKTLVNESSDDNIKSFNNISYANVSNEEGISYTENNVDNYSNNDTSIKNDNEIDYTKSFADYFHNNNNDGSYGFRLTNNLISPIELGNEKFEKLQEISLTESKLENNNIQNNILNDSSNSKINNKIEQTSYSNIFEEEYRVVGKVFNTYLILELNNEIYFIDQHAAHERMKYDELIKEVEYASIKKQDLLLPYMFNVSSVEYEYILSNIELLNQFGIEICEFGSNTFKISSVPLILSDINLSNFVSEMLSNCSGLAKSPKEILKEKFMQMACKSAVKGGDDLKDIEISALLKQLKEDTKVLLCPHGRPIVVQIDKKQIEKWFKRIV